jgi:Ca2+-binding EF-hand superfamily protein
LLAAGGAIHPDPPFVAAQDHSGAIDDRELKGFFSALGVSLTDKEVVNAMKDIDDSGDNNVAFEEMIDWLQKKGVWDEEKIGLP